MNTIMASMQGIIDEGSDHIKDLELKIKTQGKGRKFSTFVDVFVNYSSSLFGKNVYEFTP